MMKLIGMLVVLLVASTGGGCARTLEQQRVDATLAIAALEKGDFESAGRHADEVLGRGDDNAYAHLVRAFQRYHDTMSRLFADFQTVVIAAMGLGRSNARYLKTALAQAEASLESVEEDLAAATRPDIVLDFCPGCWNRDWNQDGRIDSRDEWLFAVDLDADGNEIPAGDSRRHPTFRFDVGDVVWARAFIAFHRAALDLALAFSWLDLAPQVLNTSSSDRIVIPLIEPPRVSSARDRILEGIDLAAQSRELILAETDDEREWLPSPTQKDHAIPMSVDSQLFDTWDGILNDVRRLLKAEEGLSAAEMISLDDSTQISHPPTGYINLGKMFDEPKDIVVEIETIDALDHDKNTDALFKQFFGKYYVSNMKPSPILKRAARMKDEIDSGLEPMERKLRYLLWLN
ncbi:MAG: hypothetical protein GY854_28285 [Deltaproteobacteria bacterium]|nr:hypothetical protein [Deltaproteobacteria bacterium]